MKRGLQWLILGACGGACLPVGRAQTPAAVKATADYVAPRVASFHVIASYSGREFDDAANQYVLRPYARFDVSADRELGHRVAVFAGAQNALNRTIDAGLTPILTLAAPRLVQAGLRYSLSR